MSTETSRTAGADVPKTSHPSEAEAHIQLLSRLMLSRDAAASGSDSSLAGAVDELFALDPASRGRLLELANTNHVILRTLLFAAQAVPPGGRTGEGAQAYAWLDEAIRAEQARIHNALSCLDRICNTLQAAGCNATVIKSLDHWPDLGSDLDLYSNSDPREIIRVMRTQLQAKTMARNWGDRLANKWNFQVPGLPELVEIHVGRLGQTGEHVGFGRRLQARSVVARVEGFSFRVASPEDRLVVTTLQRMYRHFYLRLCDIVDTAELLESRPVDYTYLRTSATGAGVWDGVATFLAVVSDYVAQFRGEGLGIPTSVRSSAQFGADQLTFQRNFLRIPILPHSARLYAAELTRMALSGDVQGTFRLSLLPYLATAAALEMKITGSDKGIW